MPTTHDGHRRTRPLGMDLFTLVVVGVVVFTVTSMIGGLPGYAPAVITGAVLLVVWGVLAYRGTHPPHHGDRRAH
ncbi:hypothetical protein [Streptomyces alkaliterrae]|uniref:Uncharacterized protein n=1 Tax=Streptomyces alkaliterrae TaxID=2213162 RepID=A0A5P0YWP1_9ACTN|nr:hypothetical protein [Streptomyces alkaliterrae]MBB1255550.1 hypothetical protein [Streptomyces alkaliterrae]MBB1260531.1 hypothetical protein [Streptomyces alkaliterrae]MQS04017.1 hypothetical protein [Streptomyces alkaliterrae]